MIHYELRLSDPRGQRLDFFGDQEWESFDLTRTVNNVGVGTFIFPYTDDWRQRYTYLNMISVYKTIDGGYPVLENDTVYPILYREVQSIGRRRSIIVGCADINFLVPRRGAPWYAGSAQVQKTGFSDNILKAIARENLSSAANDYSGVGSARALSASYFTVDPDFGLGASMSISFAWESSLLTVMQQIANASYQKGVYLAWDLIVRPNQPIQFKTFVNQRGVDRRVLVLSEDSGQLDNVRYFDDWREEVNAVFIAGQDQGTSRQVVRRVDTARSTAGTFAWAERIISSTQDSDNPTAHMQSIGDAALIEGRPQSGFSASFVSTPAIRYGVDFGFGDRVTCSAFGLRFETRVSSVQTSASREGAIDYRIVFTTDGLGTV